MKRNHLLLSIGGGVGALALGLLATAPAYAGTATGSLTVSANVEASCTVTTSSLDFGTLDTSGSTGDTLGTTGTGSVGYNCSAAPASFTVGTGLNNSLGSGSSTTYPYAIANGSSYLAYGLDVEDAAWNPSNAANPGGAGTNVAIGGTAGVAPTYVTGTHTFNISGDIPATQATVPGAYSDTVTLTVTY